MLTSWKTELSKATAKVPRSFARRMSLAGTGRVSSVSNVFSSFSTAIEAAVICMIVTAIETMMIGKRGVERLRPASSAGSPESSTPLLAKNVR